MSILVKRILALSEEIFSLYSRSGIAAHEGERQALLILVAALAVGISCLAAPHTAQEDHLHDSLAGVDAHRERGGVDQLDGNNAFPRWLKGRTVQHQSASAVARLSQADANHILRDREGLERFAQREGVRGNLPGLA